ncbi:dicarboxylate transporter 1 [Pyrus ussuriensis x Pyrus communis]|uniref:Dicarboxylate transporter 1 n=1 Tax=Pyrus ussuriensis x Pyrus communis TaxID=2448454 RepID=A0A5N5FSP3_9ROSA|nr:dicarboxylate transporter 1 [Pyrus ussuriensis x Pyrus communis]
MPHLNFPPNGQIKQIFKMPKIRSAAATSPPNLGTTCVTFVTPFGPMVSPASAPLTSSMTHPLLSVRRTHRQPQSSEEAEQSGEASFVKKGGQGFLRLKEVYVRPRNELAEQLHSTLVEKGQTILEEVASQLSPETLIEEVFPPEDAGLGYSLVFSEALLAPAIPSVSARAGGIFLPLVKSLCVACGSNVGDGTEGKLGSWLMLTCFQTSVVSSAMFLTAMAANPLSANLTLNTIKQTIGWTDWAKAAIVPGLVSLIVVPLLLYIIYPPEVKSSPDAPKLARERLEKMGPMSNKEIIMAGTLFLTVGLWIFGGVLSVDAVTAAILGLSVLLVTGVITWKECLAESVAWDTLTWFAALIAMAGYLNKYGLISWFSQTVVKFVGGLGLSWQASFGILVLLYFYSHYFFASGAAHIGAMFTAFLSVSTALGTPPYFGAMVLAFLSNLMGGLTHYGIGSAPWWGYGFLISVVNIIIWLGGKRVEVVFDEGFQGFYLFMDTLNLLPFILKGFTYGDMLQAFHKVSCNI